jgi:hypothetical protein
MRLSYGYAVALVANPRMSDSSPLKLFNWNPGGKQKLPKNEELSESITSNDHSSDAPHSGAD